MAVIITTNMGNITVELEAEKAPKSVENFLSYVTSGHYNNTIFHRVIDGFMIQGGGFDAEMKQKPTPQTVENEAKNGLKNGVYTLAMARTSDPHSASAQFFINTKNNGFLDYPGQDGWGYAVFGRVTEGTDVVDKIGKVKTGRSGMFSDVPVEAVVIEKIEQI
ncbi:MAG: peptidylprolyl isomerase [Pseudomonadota bacterium]